VPTLRAGVVRTYGDQPRNGVFCAMLPERSATEHTCPIKEPTERLETMSPTTTGTGSSALDPLEQETIARVKWRLIPLLFLCYYAAYLDRVNVGFAALHMNKALGLTAASPRLGTIPASSCT
jgi:hypothetical protein